MSPQTPKFRQKSGFGGHTDVVLAHFGVGSVHNAQGLGGFSSHPPPISTVLSHFPQITILD